MVTIWKMVTIALMMLSRPAESCRTPVIAPDAYLASKSCRAQGACQAGSAAGRVLPHPVIAVRLPPASSSLAAQEAGIHCKEGHS